MKFSLFSNTRQRLPFLLNMIRSIDETFSYTNEMELLLAIDDDDFETQNFLDNQLKVMLDNAPICDRVTYYKGERPSNLHVNINFLASHANGDILFGFNDDVEFLTPDWDIIIEKYITDPEVKKDNIYYIGVSDTSVDKTEKYLELYSGENYASFPILTREAYEALGYFISEKFVGLGADVHLWRIFYAVNRTICAPEIVLDHVKHNTVEKVVSPDSVAFHMRQNTYLKPVDEWNINIDEEVGRINAKITSSI